MNGAAISHHPADGLARRGARSLAGLALVFLLGLAILPGCASLPSTEVMKAETASYTLPKSPEPGKALVYVVRPSAVGGLIRFNVFVDDQEAVSEMGFNRGNQYIHFNLSPGEHKILSKAENWAEVMVTVQAGDVVYIRQDTAMGFVMARNSLARIEDYEGKYHLKSLEPGTMLKSDK